MNSPLMIAIYVGAWTRIVIRRATEDEKATLA